MARKKGGAAQQEAVPEPGGEVALGAEERQRQLAEAMAVARRAARAGLLKVLPFGTQLLASGAAYQLGITAAQIVGYCLRVSCRTPVLGPALGMFGVGFASALAGQAGAHARALFLRDPHPPSAAPADGAARARARAAAPWWRLGQSVDRDEALFDAALGILIFKAAGGRFSSLMPSDLAAPGALAFESIPAVGNDYASPGVRRELARIFRRDGCHHCGSHRGPVIGDHMPPNKLVLQRRGPGLGLDLGLWLQELPLVKQVRALAGHAPPRIRQRFYPQCQRCSYKQASALRHGRRVLVLHVRLPRQRVEHLAGVFVGLRHGAPALEPRGGDAGCGAARRRVGRAAGWEAEGGGAVEEEAEGAAQRRGSAGGRRPLNWAALSLAVPPGAVALPSLLSPSAPSEPPQPASRGRTPTRLVSPFAAAAASPLPAWRSDDDDSEEEEGARGGGGFNGGGADQTPQPRMPPQVLSGYTRWEASRRAAEAAAAAAQPWPQPQPQPQPAAGPVRGPLSEGDGYAFARARARSHKAAAAAGSAAEEKQRAAAAAAGFDGHFTPGLMY
ncbi:hypothetical protein Rsub_11787 [Raphidocelis subcapitata]|uniref:Uncharacterized protein n=1 Tax=Raphidocelis subcapitata TaxID=307507 RepID=A0A2V0PJS4_9CHLO|nr:hypothetical protein Rsub_11787 [Raphidocelis subcapitata]|eukprot:GBF99262.1 hypothetical protein Rsub_11787 [Raphidocelis subcapitata]